MDYKELVQELRRLSLDYGEQDSLNTILYLAANAIEDLITNLTASNEVITKYRGQMPKWIPCAERLPEKSGNYLVNIVCPKGKWVEVNCFYADSKDWMTIDDYAEFSTKYVTHWMPLPPPPQEGEAE